MTVESWLLFCVTETALCFTPGPAVLLVVSLGLSRGFRAGFLGALGILSANALYFVISASSLGAVLTASGQLFFLIKWMGAAYLIWIGMRMLLAREKTPPGGVSSPDSQSTARPLAHGFVTQGANPKVFVFFSALLPQFIDPGAAVAPQVAILGISSILIELAVLCLYAALAQRARLAVARTRIARIVQRAGGALLIGAGAGLATLRRTP